VLGVAERRMTATRASAADERELTLVGFLLFRDPPRADAAPSLRRLEQLGVELKVLSGDSVHVTHHVCREVGLVVAEADVVDGAVIGGLDDAGIAVLARERRVFARLSPEQKHRIVAALGAAGHVTGFLGDGVNDGPALRAADVGIAVDAGTDVAKEAADIVLLRKDLSVLAGGVLAGRTTFANVTKYLHNTVSANFGNMLTVALASLALPFIPLLPSQILLNNFLSDVPLVTVATDRVDQDELRRPRSWSMTEILRFLLYFGTLSAAFDLILLGTFVRLLRADAATLRTAWFLESVVSEIVVTFVIRTRRPLWRSVPGRALVLSSVACVAVAAWIPVSALGGRLFEFVPLTFTEASVVALVLVGYVLAAEAAKPLYYRHLAPRVPRSARA
jgi:Mg2+-importing ATPase